MKKEDIKQGNGFGYKDRTGHICMIRCFECGRENYAIAVAAGQCAWCGHNPNKQFRPTESFKVIDGQTYRLWKDLITEETQLRLEPSPEAV